MATDLHDTPNKTDTATRPSLTAVVASYLKARPNIWLDGREIQQIAGAYAWRTRLSDIRRAPYYMNIENRQRRIKTASGDSFTVSEYMFVPEEEKTEATTGIVTSGMLLF